MEGRISIRLWEVYPSPRSPGAFMALYSLGAERLSVGVKRPGCVFDYPTSCNRNADDV
jgi:hypothetical protein